MPLQTSYEVAFSYGKCHLGVCFLGTAILELASSGQKR